MEVSGKSLGIVKLVSKGDAMCCQTSLFLLRAALSLLTPCCLTDPYPNGENQVSMTAQIKGIAP